MFDGAGDDAGVDTAISQCRAEKSMERMHDKNNASPAATSSGLPETGETTNSTPSLAIRFLQSFLIASFTVTTLCFAFLVRRYLVSKKKQKQLMQKITDRACRDESSSSSSYEQSPSQSLLRQSTQTELRLIKQESNNGHSITENSDKSQIMVRDRDEEDQFCGIGEAGNFALRTDSIHVDEYDSDDTEVEIMFENPFQQDSLRQSVFTNSFSPHFLAKDYNDDNDGMMMIEHAIPAMTTLLQQEAVLRQNEKLQQQLQQQLVRQNSPNSVSTVQPTSIGEDKKTTDLIPFSIQQPSPTQSQNDQAQQGQFHPYPALVKLKEEGDGILRTSTSATTKKRIRVPLGKLLKKSRNNVSTSKSRQQFNIEANESYQSPPTYHKTTSKDGQDRWMYEDAVLPTVENASTRHPTNNNSNHIPEQSDFV